MKRLDDMNDAEIEALFERLKPLIAGALPPGVLGGGRCGYILALVDTTTTATPTACVQFMSNLDREDAPELLHEIAEFLENEIDEEASEDDE